MSKKQTTAPAECLKMNIELADNGIIIRNPENEDEVTLAMNKGEIGDTIYDDDIYKAIGKKVYDWILDVVMEEHTDFIITNFDIDITATCNGHEFR